MNKKIIIANWKMHPARAADAVALAKKVERVAAAHPRVEVVIAPPSLFLIPVARVLKKSALGAQNVFWEETGPYTGEISPGELKSAGVSYVIVGHSERRTHAGETDRMIQKKLSAILRRDMQAVLCVGEQERQGNDLSAVVGDQIKIALAGLKASLLKRVIIAYEPVWAISTAPQSVGTASPDSAFRARLSIEKTLAALFGARAARDTRIIYGGSVTPDNAAGFFTEGNMDGVLVGNASLDAKAFGRIVAEVARY